MSHQIDREIRELRRAGQRLEVASKEWGAAYRQYVGALQALSQKTAASNTGLRYRFPKAMPSK